MTKTELRTAIRTAVAEAITAVGVGQFKKTSFFLSNDCRELADKMAA